jgi:hypothetical protein
MAFGVDYSCDVILARNLVKGGDTLVVSSLVDLGVSEGR